MKQERLGIGAPVFLVRSDGYYRERAILASFNADGALLDHLYKSLIQT